MCLNSHLCHQLQQNVMEWNDSKRVINFPPSTYLSTPLYSGAPISASQQPSIIERAENKRHKEKNFRPIFSSLYLFLDYRLLRVVAFSSVLDWKYFFDKWDANQGWLKRYCKLETSMLLVVLSNSQSIMHQNKD